MKIFSKKEYIFNADLVRTLAIIGAVGIHILSPIFARPDFFNGTLWWASFLINVLFRTSVPLFIILSGYLVLGKEISIKENFSRAIHRIFIPLISFYTLFHAYAFYASWARQEPFIIGDYFSNLTKNTHTYLYFLVILFFLYLFIPLFQPLLKNASKQASKYVIALIFTNAALGIFFRYLTLREGETFHTFSFWLLWVGYFLFGYWYRKYDLNLKSGALVGILSISYIVTAVFGYLNFLWFNQGNDIFYINGQSYAEEYLSLGVISMSLSLFVILMRLKFPKNLLKNKIFTNSVKKIAVLSYGIYLIHPIVMDYINKFQGITADSPSMPNLWIYILVNGSITFFASFILTYLIQKTPLVRKIVGLK